MLAQTITTPAAPATITGRDHYIIAKALLYAIATIQNLPEEQQDWSDVNDMCAIMRTQLQNPLLVQMCDEVRLHTGFMPILWPEDDADLSVEEKRRRDEFGAAVLQYRQNWERLKKLHPELGGEAA